MSYGSHSNTKTELARVKNWVAFPTKEVNHFKATSYLILTSISSVTLVISAGD